ncbi:rRNA pseudouridine synthase [Candidatus Peregrinibacteria bacterium]|nr:MAG: rRNA pseudouridine synthase [Candidatus Peregrinibacteria bacterium]
MSSLQKQNAPLRERLHKVIAASGLCSRREAEELIAKGRVHVNGKRIQKMGIKVSPLDKIEVDGRVLPEKAAPLTLALHKPVGLLTSKKDPFHSETVMDLLPTSYQHLNPIGRLDKDSEGLLLLTSDGALLERLTHPKYGHVKTYEVLVQGDVTDKEIELLRTGPIHLDDYLLRPMQARILSQEVSRMSGKTYTWLEMKLGEGRKRQIRRVMEGLGFPVRRLIRTAIGKVQLGKLKPGKTRPLTDEELRDLYS